MIVYIYVQTFTMVCSHFCTSINHRSAHIKHFGSGKSLVDNFVTYSVDITMRDSYFYLVVVHTNNGLMIFNNDVRFHSELSPASFSCWAVVSKPQAA